MDYPATGRTTIGTTNCVQGIDAPTGRWVKIDEGWVKISEDGYNSFDFNQ